MSLYINLSAMISSFLALSWFRGDSALATFFVPRKHRAPLSSDSQVDPIWSRRLTCALSLEPWAQVESEETLHSVSNISSATTESTISSTEVDEVARRQAAPHRRRIRFGMPGGTCATSDRIRFSVAPVIGTDKSESEPRRRTKKAKKRRETKTPRWFVTFGDSTGLIDTAIPTKQQHITGAVLRAAAEAAFQVHASLEDGKNAKRIPRSHERKAKQLSSLLKVPVVSARRMIRLAPGLAGMDIPGILPRRCVDMSVLFRCTPPQFAAVVKRFPCLLAFRVETIATKMFQLDRLLSGCKIEHVADALTGALVDEPGGRLLAKEEASFSNWTEPLHVTISDSTLAIARRVPELLASDVSGTLCARAISLRDLLFVEPNRRDQDEALAKVLKRCPELLLYNIEATIPPKLEQLSSLLDPANGSFVDDEEIDVSDRANHLGAMIALKEPRLLLYDVEESLLPKAQLWRARVEDAAPFNALLFRYPTLLMYSFGAAARLEYFCYVNERKPDASEARQLLMLPRKAVEAWGDHDGCVSDSTPAILGGIVTKRGRPCLGESAADAFDRRAVRRAAQPCAPQQFGEMNVHELRILLRKNGGTPSVKRKAQLISELKTLGCSPDKEQDIHRENTAQANDASGNSQISYRQWMAIKLCYAYPEFLGVYDTSVTRGRSSFAGDEGTARSAGGLEKLWGMARKGSVKAKSMTLR